MGHRVIETYTELKRLVSRYSDQDVINEYGPIGQWRFSPQVNNLSSLFQDNVTFNEDISGWDVSNIEYMAFMFQGATSFNQPIGNWNVSRVISMNAMFNRATSFNQPIGNWNVSRVMLMNSMFSGASSFNQPLDNWNVSGVTNMNSMFSNASSFNQPIGNWDVSRVTRMGYMFSSAISFNQPLENWNISNVEIIEGMFAFATSFNQPLNNWNIGNNINILAMFTDSGISIENIPESVFNRMSAISLYQASLNFNCDRSLEMGYNVDLIKKIAFIKCDSCFFRTLVHRGYNLTYDDLILFIRYTADKIPYVMSDPHDFRLIIVEILQAVNLTDAQLDELSNLFRRIAFGDENYRGGKPQFMTYVFIIQDLLIPSQVVGGRRIRRYKNKRITKKKVTNKKRKSVKRHK